MWWKHVTHCKVQSCQLARQRRSFKRWRNTPSVFDLVCCCSPAPYWLNPAAAEADGIKVYQFNRCLNVIRCIWNILIFLRFLRLSAALIPSEPHCEMRKCVFLQQTGGYQRFNSGLCCLRLEWQNVFRSRWRRRQRSVQHPRSLSMKFNLSSFSFSHSDDIHIISIKIKRK